MNTQVKELTQVKLSTDFAKGCVKQQISADEGWGGAPVKLAAQAPKMERKGV